MAFILNYALAWKNVAQQLVKDDQEMLESVSYSDLFMTKEASTHHKMISEDN